MTQAPVGAAGRIVTGAEYVKQITALESDRRARAAFHDLVLRIAPRGAPVLDFGCGTGIDARFYAERGFTVLAYDVDPQMCDFFEQQCRDLIAAGRVSLERGDYRSFLARGGARGIALVASNFAPLNLISNLRELFARFAELTGSDGRVLASVLSPYFIGDLRYGWWWRNALRLWREGCFSVAGAQAPIVRRRLADFATQSEPYFTLTRVFPGRPRQDACGIEFGPGRGRAWLRLTTCRYMFLLFEKPLGPKAQGRGSGGRHG